MGKIDAVLKATDHRPFPLPVAPWKYYQEWHGTYFLHWDIPIGIIRELLPAELDVDTFEGKAWVSLVAFSIKGLRMRNLPSFQAVSNFHEVNLRTYVTKDGKPGIHFFSIEASKLISVMITKTLIGLDYQKADISRNRHEFKLVNETQKNSLTLKYDYTKHGIHKTLLDIWLTERYCVFQKEEGEIYEYNIHHREWLLQETTFEFLQIYYEKGNLLLNKPDPDLIHYCDFLRVLTWGKRIC